MPTMLGVPLRSGVPPEAGVRRPESVVEAAADGLPRLRLLLRICTAFWPQISICEFDRRSIASSLRKIFGEFLDPGLTVQS